MTLLADEKLLYKYSIPYIYEQEKGVNTI